MWFKYIFHIFKFSFFDHLPDSVLLSSFSESETFKASMRFSDGCAVGDSAEGT